MIKYSIIDFSFINSQYQIGNLYKSLNQLIQSGRQIIITDTVLREIGNSSAVAKEFASYRNANPNSITLYDYTDFNGTSPDQLFQELPLNAGDKSIGRTLSSSRRVRELNRDFCR